LPNLGVSFGQGDSVGMDPVTIARQEGPTMTTRNVLYLVVGALVVVVAILGYRVYQDRQEPGIDINIGKSGISIEKR
jgi:hypothetical protein